MEEKNIENVLNLGTLLGRKQALGMIATRCTTAEIECLIQVHDNKLYLAVDFTWEDYCKRLGLSRRTAERLMQQYKQYGPNLARLNSFTPIKSSEYRLFAATVTDEGLLHNGETIPLEPENSLRLSQVVEAIRQESEAEPADPAARAFDKAEKALKSAVTEFGRLQAMNLDEASRIKLVLAIEQARNQLDLIHMALPV
jgi:hypothetical protein